MPPELVLSSLSEPPPPGSRTVRTDDGVDLHVEVEENPAAPVTVVLAHGFTARLAEWEIQRRGPPPPAPPGAVAPRRPRPPAAPPPRHAPPPPPPPPPRGG